MDGGLVRSSDARIYSSIKEPKKIKKKFFYNKHYYTTLPTGIQASVCAGIISCHEALPFFSSKHL